MDFYYTSRTIALAALVGVAGLLIGSALNERHAFATWLLRADPSILLGALVTAIGGAPLNAALSARRVRRVVREEIRDVRANVVEHEKSIAILTYAMRNENEASGTTFLEDAERLAGARG